MGASHFPKVVAPPPTTPGREGTDEEAIAIASKFCKLTEKFEPLAYKDPLSADGLPITIGFGSTRDTNGRSFRLGDRIDHAEALKLLDCDLSASAIALKASIPHWGILNAGQKATLLSLDYNEGYRYQDGDHDTLDGLLYAQNYAAVPECLLKYSKDANGEIAFGLLRRRYAEGLLWRGATATNAHAKAWGMQTEDEIRRAIA